MHAKFQAARFYGFRVMEERHTHTGTHAHTHPFIGIDTLRAIQKASIILLTGGHTASAKP